MLSFLAGVAVGMALVPLLVLLALGSFHLKTHAQLLRTRRRRAASALGPASDGSLSRAAGGRGGGGASGGKGGFLLVRHGVVGDWKRRWCVFRDPVVTVSADRKTQLASDPQVSLKTHPTVTICDAECGKENAFALAPPKTASAVDTWFFAAASHVDLRDWLLAIPPSAAAGPAKKRLPKRSTARRDVGLYVFVVEAADLPAADKGGTSDPFCTIRLGDLRFTTRIVYKTLHPKWHERYWFPGAKLKGALELEVFDHDAFGRDFLGSGKVVELPQDDAVYDFWVPVPSSGGSEVRPSVGDSTNYGRGPRVRLQMFFVSADSALDAHLLGTLEITAEEARGLHAADAGGTSDPFCTVALGPTQHKTQPCFKTLTPVWKTKFSFPVRDLAANLRIEVFDKDRFSNDFLGHCILPIRNIAAADPAAGIDNWYELAGSIGKGKRQIPAKGSIHLISKFVPNPAAAAAAATAADASRPPSPSTETAPSETAPASEDAKGRLYITVARAEKLLAADWTGFSDPYANLTLGTFQKSTRIIRKTLSPKWDFTVSVNSSLYEPTDTLIVSVFDHDNVGKDDYLGGVQVPIYDAVTSKAYSEDWYTLEDLHMLLPGTPQPPKLVTGRIYISIAFREGDIDDSDSEANKSRTDSGSRLAKLGTTLFGALLTGQAADASKAKARPKDSFEIKLMEQKYSNLTPCILAQTQLIKHLDRDLTAAKGNSLLVREIKRQKAAAEKEMADLKTIKYNLLEELQAYRAYSIQSTESSHWLNFLLMRVLLQYISNPAFIPSTKQKLYNEFNNDPKMPAMVGEIRVDEMSIGDQMPVIEKVEVFTSPKEGEMALNFDIGYTGNASMTLTATVVLNKLVTVPVRVSVALPSFTGKMRLYCPAISEQRNLIFTLSFMEDPDWRFEFELKIGDSSKFGNLSAIKIFIANKLKLIVRNMLVFPNELLIPLPDPSASLEVRDDDDDDDGDDDDDDEGAAGDMAGEQQQQQQQQQPQGAVDVPASPTSTADEGREAAGSTATQSSAVSDAVGSTRLESGRPRSLSAIAAQQAAQLARYELAQTAALDDDDESALSARMNSPSGSQQASDFLGPPQLSGWLKKRAKVLWKRRFFVLPVGSTTLYSFRQAPQAGVEGTLSYGPGNMPRALEFSDCVLAPGEWRPRRNLYGFDIQQPGQKVLSVSAPTPNEAMAWIEALLRAGIGKVPGFDAHLESLDQ